LSIKNAHPCLGRRPSRRFRDVPAGARLTIAVCVVVLFRAFRKAMRAIAVAANEQQRRHAYRIVALLMLGGLAVPIVAIASMGSAPRAAANESAQAEPPRQDVAAIGTAEPASGAPAGAPAETEPPAQPQPAAQPEPPGQPEAPARVVPPVGISTPGPANHDGGTDNGPRRSGNDGQVDPPVDPVVVDQAPVVNAGSDQTMLLPTSSVMLSGTVTDDGLPNPPGATTSAWTQVSGPATVAFKDPSALATTVSGFTAAGDYVLRLTADDSALTSFDELTVHVVAAVATTPSAATPRVNVVRVESARVSVARVKAPRARRPRAVRVNPKLTG
jgi:hypothetical protein